ncbi:MAG: DUF2029 domain-containing protein [Phycisphaeraceae bacterium]|nr:DUF2029 domain-containing protein [Phycisphaeraceae bacterium]
MTHAADQQQGSDSLSRRRVTGGVSGNSLRLLIFLAALVWFTIHGPYNGLLNSSDLRLIYAQSRAWLEGRNPYHHEDLFTVLINQGVDVAGAMPRDHWPAIYPPTMHPLIAPLALMPWPAARVTWILVNLAVLVGTVVLLWRWVGWSIDDPRGRWLILITLLFWPLHTGFGTGQLTLLSLMLGLAAADCDRRGRTLCASLLLGAGIALKPQVAGVLWLWLALEGRWRACLWSFLVPLLSGSLGAAVLYLNDVPWLADLRRNLADNALGGGGDPTPVNPLRFQLLNLQWPLHEFIHSRWLVNALVLAIALLVTVAATIAARRRRDHLTSMLLLATLASLSMLIVYRRMYDAVMLLPAVAVQLDAWGRWPRWVRGLSATAVFAYLTPGSVMWLAIADRAQMTASVVDTWWWRGVILPYQVWLTLLLTLLLLSRLLAPTAVTAPTDPHKDR